MDMILSQLDWRAPSWGLLMLVPLALAGLARRRRHRLLAYAEAPLRPWALLSSGEQRTSRGQSLFWWLAWLCLTVAAMGPRQALDSDADHPGQARHRMTLLVALDVSASMAAMDTVPSRLERARLEVADLIKRLNGERLGLILYAGQAGLLLPPTDDTSLLEAALARVTPGLIEQHGTYHAAALTLALAQLSPGKGAVLLVTDGDADSLKGPAGEAAQTAAATLKAADIPLYILGMGTDTGAEIPLADGEFIEQDSQRVISNMDRGALSSLARATGGRFVVASDGDADWSELYDGGIARLPSEPMPAEQARAWRELYTSPLLAALVFFLLSHGIVGAIGKSKGKGKGQVIMLAALTLAAPIPDTAHAGTTPDATLWQQAYTAYQAGRYGEAHTLYTRLGGYPGHMGAGATAWRLNDYTTAAGHYANALILARTAPEQADALYSLGNANYGLARYGVSVEAYRAVLALRPGDPKATANLAMAEDRARRAKRKDPMRTDLKARRGSLAEGEINLDWDREVAIEEFEPEPERALVDREGNTADGARLQGIDAAQRRVEADARRLASGLAKLRLIEDQPQILLKGLLSQDRPATGNAPELSPW